MQCSSVAMCWIFEFHSKVLCWRQRACSAVAGLGVSVFLIASQISETKASFNEFQEGRFPAVIEPISLLPDQDPDGERGLVINGAYASQFVGSALATGDFNADGVDDILAGFVPDSPIPGVPPSGAALILGQSDLEMGSDGVELLDAFDGLIGPEQIVLAVDPLELGYRARNLGDIDHDGIDDFGLNKRIPLLDRGFREGRLFIVYGGSEVEDAFVNYPDLLPENGGDGSRGIVFTGLDTEFLGRDFFGDHDISGDGYDDLILLSNRVAEPVRGLGQAFVLYGSPGRTWPAEIDTDFLLNMPVDQGFSIIPPVPEELMSVDTGFPNARFIEDMNSDGIDEIIMCRPISQQVGTQGNGTCYVIFGRAGPAPFPAVLDLGILLERNGGDGSGGFVVTGGDLAILGSNTRESRRGGYDVGSAGDFDGDGHADLVINAPGSTVFGVSTPPRSEAYLIYGGQSFPAEIDFRDGFAQVASQIRITRFRSEVEVGPGDNFATAIQGVGDLNADGFDDISISAEFTLDTPNTGSWVIFGRPDMPEEFTVESLLPENGGNGSGGFIVRNFLNEEGLGQGITHGDFDNDGIDDVVLGGAVSDPGGRSNAGRVVVIYGRGSQAVGVPVLSITGLVLMIGLFGFLTCLKLRNNRPL